MIHFMPLKWDVVQANILVFGFCVQMKLCLYNPNQVIKRSDLCAGCQKELGICCT